MALQMPCFGGLVVELIVAIDQAPVRFRVKAICSITFWIFCSDHRGSYVGG